MRKSNITHILKALVTLTWAADEGHGFYKTVDELD